MSVRDLKGMDGIIIGVGLRHGDMLTVTAALVKHAESGSWNYAHKGPPLQNMVVKQTAKSAVYM